MVPDRDDNRANILDEVLTQFVNAYVQGEQPDIDEFIEQYPQHEAQIRRRVEGLREIDALFDSLVQADESDFENVAASENLIGQKLGHFETVKMIGRGGMGVVYLARDTKLKRSVAIKSMPAGLVSDSTARMRFRREAELLASLNHPNIAVIYDIIEQDERTGYLVLEYVPGETLARRIGREPLKSEEALSIGRQVAEAVSAAHQKGVVHRDLKPGNIKITPEGRVKVLDFGLAKAPVREDKPADITATRPGRVVGTPAYMSPEQARGKDTDHRTDIWSFGCIMFQMLTGRLPFEGETATDTLAHIIEREPDWERLPRTTPTNIRELLRHCLEKDPDQRLGDIADADVEISETLNLPRTARAVRIPAKSQKMTMIIGAVIIIVLSAIAVRFILQQQAQPSTGAIRVVVLPFENLGSAANEDFVDGITDEMITRLASIHRFGVISRHSAMRYKNRERSVRQIAKELRVDYILDGTILCERPSDPNSPVRMSAQLIRATDDTHVWAQAYDSDMRGVFRLQSDVAVRVSEALNIALLEAERQVLASVPTEDMEAYNYYLRGNDYYYRSEAFFKSDLRLAIGRYEKAVELDPNLALAHAQLSRAHICMYKHYYDRSEERLATAKRAVDRALQLDPDLPEAHFALGHYYYHGHLDYDRALDEFAVVRQRQPHNSELLSFIGAVQRRQGKFEQALANLKNASELDPLSSRIVYDIGVTLMFLRKYPEAERYYERAISLAPDRPLAYRWKAWLYLLWEGNPKKACKVLEEASQITNLTKHRDIVNSLVAVNVIEGNYQEALDRLSVKPEGVDGVGFSTALRYAQIYTCMNQDERAKERYDYARSILESKIQERPEDAGFHSALGIAYAGLGLKQDAIREGELAVEILPVSKEAMVGPAMVQDLARIYTMVGKYDAAIDQLEFLLSIPSTLSIPLLRLDPAWDPLRNHPRFKKLAETGN